LTSEQKNTGPSGSGDKSAQFLSMRTGYLGTNYPNSDRIEINNLKKESAGKIKLHDYRVLAQ
jgi:hypothetical protein